MSEQSSNNKRIAKNTILLYFRMFILMGISLYTSRVILRTLGVEDYGIYNVVGGFVSMFSILTGSLSAAISRFITVELGKGDQQKLRNVFATSVKVQLLMSLVVAALGEIIGLWFMKTQMQIPAGREYAAQWVLHFSILSFIVSLVNVPFNSTIIAHERMSAFAYISIFEAALKLGIVYLLVLTGFDRLITYAILMLLVQITLTSIYWIFCRTHFTETHGHSTFDKDLFTEMWGFAGWNLLGNGAYVLNTQGVNMVMNVYFGVVVNAARGIANQVNGVVQQFANSFMMAFNPQITKSYAVGDKQTAFTLVCRGAKFSYLLMLFLSLPIMFEAELLLKLWLGTPPDGSVPFVIWTLLATMTIVTGQPLLTLQMAHGDIKKYQVYVTVFGLAPFPLTWLGYKLGAPALWAYIIYFIVYYVLIYVRIWLVHEKTGIPYKMFILDVIGRTHIVSLISIIAPLAVVSLMPQSVTRLFVTFLSSMIFTTIISYVIGLNRTEKDMVNRLLTKVLIKK